MTVRQLTEKKANLFNQMKDVYNAAEKESRSVTAEELAKVEAIESDLSATERQLRNLQAFQARKKEMEDGQEAVLQTRNGREKIDAFNQYLRRGAYGMDPKLKPYLQRGTNPQTTSDTAGGYTIPEGWLGELDVAKKFIGMVEGLARTINTPTGNVLPIPKVDDTATNAALQTEGSGITVADMTFGNTDLSAYTYATLVKVSEQLAQDEDVNLASYLVDLLGERVARITNAALTTGDGSAKPNGVITAAATGKTTASATAITDEELIDLFYSVDPAYRMGESVKWMMNDTVHAYIRKLGLIAAENYNPITFDQTGTMFILGKEVKINQDMESSIATGNATVLFGDFSGYMVRTAGGLNIKRLDQRFADELNIGYIAYRRIDGDLISAGSPLKKLVQA